jgi:4-amino-4-deoxy-L-arabinose transferase-like glycosyltransferase
MTKHATAWLVILTVALLARILAANYWHGLAESEGNLFRLGDSLSYWTLGEQIAAGKPYQYGSSDASVFRAPLYPILLAPLTTFADPWRAVWFARLLGCCLGTVAVFLLGRLTNACFSERLGNRPGFIAAALAAVYPSAIGMSVTVLAEALFMPLFIAYLLAWAKATKSKYVSRWALSAGCLAGLAILARPSLMLFLPGCVLAAVVVLPNRRKQLQITLISLTALCVTMNPWWVRNASITGKFVLTTLQVGPSLRDGLHPGATGASDTGMSFMDETYLAQKAEDAQKQPKELESTLEWRINKRASGDAVRWACENPGKTIQLAISKFLRTWSVWPDGGELGSTAVRIAITLSTFPVVILASIATWLVRRRIAGNSQIPTDQASQAVSDEHLRWSVWLCWLPCLYFTALHMVFVGSIRYREPAVFVLIALAAVSISQAPSLFRRRS